MCLAEPTDGNLAIGQRGKVELVITDKGKNRTLICSERRVSMLLKRMGPVLDYIFRKPCLFLLNPAMKSFGEGTVTVTDCRCEAWDL